MSCGIYKIVNVKNGNIKTFSLTNIETNEEFIFDSLVDGANYLIGNGLIK
jgi:hypothetical protein